jgi:RimJ/RimL family protein N-acetyltransferase
MSGLTLDAAAQGKGYAAERAFAAIDWTFAVLGWDRIIHCIHKDNAPSIRLAERLGSSRQREDVPLPSPIGGQVDVYGQTRAQWQTRRR